MTENVKLEIGLFNVYMNCVIVEHNTGILYYGQVGGMGCYDPKVEGFPIFLDDSYWDRLQEITHEHNCGDFGFNEECVVKLKENWVKSGYSSYMILLDEDAERLAKGTECWIPVVLKRNDDVKESGGFADWLGESGKKGWLLLRDNCD